MACSCLWGLPLTVCWQMKLSPSAKSIISLIQILATSTFFCGLLTGTFFGANIYDLPWPFIQRLKSAVFMDNNDMFQLSLILGAVQILFGMVLKAVNQTIQFGFKYACDDRVDHSSDYRWLFRRCCRK